MYICLAQLYTAPVVDTSEPLPTVIEELANMVAVSGEELEDIARERNKDTPELRYDVVRPCIS
jgi:hypothetical protein